MSDSLRDQLIAAGFEAPKKKPDKAHRKKKRSGKKKKNNKSTAAKKPTATKPNGQTADAQNEKDILARKQQKAQIKELIDNNKLENWKGEVAYRYLVDKRIRELYVNDAAHKQLTERQTAITRLNGDTYLVPLETAKEIININPQWSVFNTEESQEAPAEDDEYSEFQVPDDLKW